MASRLRTKGNANNGKKSAGDDIQSSQPSTNSTDEQELKDLLKFKAKRDRQQTAMYNEYKKELTSAMEERRVATINAFLQDIHIVVNMGDNFISEQMVAQATIQDLLVQLANSQKEFANCTRKYRTNMVVVEETRAECHLNPLSLQKRACEDHLASIKGLKHGF